MLFYRNSFFQLQSTMLPAIMIFFLREMMEYLAEANKSAPESRKLGEIVPFFLLRVTGC